MGSQLCQYPKMCKKMEHLNFVSNGADFLLEPPLSWYQMGNPTFKVNYEPMRFFISL